jgi:hypothetical protein
MMQDHRADSHMTIERHAAHWVRWVRLGVLGSFVFLVLSWLARPWVWGDTPFVFDGTNAFLDCIHDGDFVACRHRDEPDFWGLTTPIGDWPLLQHVPDLVAIGLGADSHHTREVVLVVLSAAGLVGAVIAGHVALTRIGQPAWFWGFLAVLLASPLLVYGRSTAGEALTTGILASLVAATVIRAPPPVIAVAAGMACLTKETSYPFVVAVGAAGLLLARRRTGEPIRSHLLWGAGGVAVGILAASLFNVVRFGSVLNTNYLERELHTPGVIRPLEYALALVLSPNGGMAVFWPAASGVLALACLLPLALQRGSDLPQWPALLLVGVIVALTLGFAAWWDPFGSGYGPRLALPWVLPLVLLALAAYGPELGAVTVRLLSPTWRLLAVCALLIALVLPHIGHLWKPDATARFFATERPPCDAPWRGGVDEWHACQENRLWFDRRPMPLYSIEGVATPGGAVTALVVALGLIGCLVLLRHDLARCSPAR